MTVRPRTNTLITRAAGSSAPAARARPGSAADLGAAGARPARRRGGRGSPGNARIVSTGTAVSASPPTSRHHHVPTASTSHSRSARSGSVMCVFCQSQPPL